MIIDAASFKSFFPEFSSQTDEKINIYLSAAKLRVSEKKFKSTYELAVLYLTAHMLSTALNNKSSGGSGAGSRGNVTAEKVGDLSISYSSVAAPSSSSGFSAQLGETSYGREFIQLRKEKIYSMTVANSAVNI